jgi:exonuclease III
MEDVLQEIINYQDVNASVLEDFSDFNFFNEHSGNTFSILSLNIRSLNKNFDELTIILDSFKKQFDIIVLTETWVDESSAYGVRMPGYNVVINKKSINQNDGVVVFLKKCFNVISEEVSMFGATCVKVDVTFGGARLSLLSVYRSPSSDLSLFIDDLESFLDSRPRDRTYWLLGDINCCILPNSINSLSQRYLDVLYGSGFISCINVPTRVTENTESCLEHIFTDAKDTQFIKSAVIKCALTDHFFYYSTNSIRKHKFNPST